MLILPCRVGERIHIGDDVTITVTRIDRYRARIGIEAPREIPAYREEIIERWEPKRAGEGGAS